MHTFAVTVKGQVVIPAEIRQRHHITKGTRICFLEKGNDIILRPINRATIDALRGSLKTGGEAMKIFIGKIAKQGGQPVAFEFAFDFHTCPAPVRRLHLAARRSYFRSVLSADSMSVAAASVRTPRPHMRSGDEVDQRRFFKSPGARTAATA